MVPDARPPVTGELRLDDFLEYRSCPVLGQQVTADGSQVASMGEPIQVSALDAGIEYDATLQKCGHPRDPWWMCTP